MRKLYLFLLFAVCSIFLIKVVFAQGFGPDWSAGYDSVKNWFSAFLGIPKDLMATDKIFRYVMLPFLAVFIAVLGIMRDISLFRRSRLDWILALLISFIILPWSHVMGNLILWLYGTGGLLAVTAVGGMFIVGIGFWVLGKWFFHTGELSAARTINNEIASLERNRLTLEARWTTAVNNGNTTHAHALRQQMDRIDARIRQIRQAQNA